MAWWRQGPLKADNQLCRNLGEAYVHSPAIGWLITSLAVASTGDTYIHLFAAKMQLHYVRFSLSKGQEACNVVSTVTINFILTLALHPCLRPRLWLLATTSPNGSNLLRVYISSHSLISVRWFRWFVCMNTCFLFHNEMTLSQFL